jgi:hypothetical protein
VTAIIIGGHARKVGKTSIAAGLISAFPNVPWTAVKVSSHRHSGVDEIYRETSRSGDSDSSRYLIAGASKSIWVQAEEDDYVDVMRRLLPIIQSDPFLLIESNRILSFIQPDLTILVLNPKIEEFKKSARNMLLRIHAIITIGEAAAHPAWMLPSDTLARLPVFSTSNPQILPKSFIDFVRSHCPGLK